MKCKKFFLIAFFSAFLVSLSGCVNTHTDSTLYDKERDKNVRIILPADYKDTNIVKSAFDLKPSKYGVIYYEYYIGQVKYKRGNEYLVFPNTTPNLELDKKIKISNFDTNFIIRNDKNIHIGDKLLITKARGSQKYNGSIFSSPAYYYSYSKIKEK